MNNKQPKTKLLAASLLLFTSAFSYADTTAVPVTVETVQSRTLDTLVEEAGKITATDSANLSFSIGEKIKAIYFNDGDTVKKGSLIAELDSTKAKADFDKAKSSLNLAKTKLARTQNLLKKQPDALSPQDLDELKEQVNLAAADFRQKQAVLLDYQIIAPFDGRLTTFQRSLGSHIDASSPLVSLYSLDPVKISYTISQDDLSKAAKGQPVKMTVDADDNQTFHGKVSYVAPAVDENSGRVEVHAHFANPDHTLVPGMFAHVTHRLARGKKQRLIPQNAVMANHEERFVWVIENGHPVKQKVQLGPNTNDGYVVVRRGVKKGQQVVTTGQQKLTADSTVKVLHRPATETPSPAPEDS
ncbi:efflux RND transporter periplasmic adaptor subunit [Photobacterium atrarenae]|uniref:Efflux RND transporter periplasmic adaptor subunit n=1 Tax=Photobacterium atrarenae TaxID=865757 RepID=A0ABY5GDS8_9GAMM|nr:efflux RND transporter periplasmic adaptor subunit [Photobacterium atrarenae]UTV26874.1 efflux RND transporter periplasmic adaptor subunit [Photobacterium atrarenae]